MLDVAIRGEQVKKLGGAVCSRLGQLTQLLTLLIAFLYIYMTIGFVAFNDEFEVYDDGTGCSTLIECAFTFMNYGLREDVGIATVMQSVEWSKDGLPTGGMLHAFGRLLYDVTYWLFVTILVLSMLTGIIIDTFGEMRDATNRIEDNIQTECFICGISAARFDRDGNGFKHHVKGAHNKWMYVAFWMHLLEKPQEDHNGQESYMYDRLKNGDLSVFPLGVATELMCPKKTT